MHPATKILRHKHTHTHIHTHTLTLSNAKHICTATAALHGRRVVNLCGCELLKQLAHFNAAHQLGVGCVQVLGAVAVVEGLVDGSL